MGDGSSLHQVVFIVFLMFAMFIINKGCCLSRVLQHLNHGRLDTEQPTGWYSNLTTNSLSFYAEFRGQHGVDDLD